MPIDWGFAGQVATCLVVVLIAWRWLLGAAVSWEQRARDEQAEKDGHWWI